MINLEMNMQKIICFCRDTRCKRINSGVYAYEQKDESERGCWHEIAYIFTSKELACNHGFEC